MATKTLSPTKVTLATPPTVAAAKAQMTGQGMLASLLQVFSAAFLRTKNNNDVQVALQTEAALFEGMIEELRASRELERPLEASAPPLALIDSQGQIITTIKTTPNPNLSKFHIILDIDGTLVHTVAQHEGMIFGEPDMEEFELQLCSYKRPGLDQFINFCFTHFQSVSLWTAGTQEYADFIARSIAPKGFQFMFVLSRAHCKDHPVHPNSLVKDMNDLWASEIAKTFNINEGNSLILDDNEDYCFMNPKNSILIKTWKLTHANDFAFHNLLGYLEKAEADTAASLCWGAI